MNTIKYRPVGKQGPIVLVKVTQKKRAICSTDAHMRSRSVAFADKVMDRRGFVRAGVRHV